MTVRNLVEQHAGPLIVCSSCGQPITTDDFFDLGLRLPDDGETQDDYFDAELIDSLSHAACLGAKSATVDAGPSSR